MHRKTACCSDGNTARQRHSWDEAFAQVCFSPATQFPAPTLALACVLPSGSTHALTSVRTPLDIFTSSSVPCHRLSPYHCAFTGMCCLLLGLPHILMPCLRVATCAAAASVSAAGFPTPPLHLSLSHQPLHKQSSATLLSASNTCSMQVMLAQQESIAQLMTLYEAVRSQTEEELQQVLGHGYGQTDHQLEALHQEHGLGQAHMKKDRCCFTCCTSTSALSQCSCLPGVLLLGPMCEQCLFRHGLFTCAVAATVVSCLHTSMSQEVLLALCERLTRLPSVPCVYELLSRWRHADTCTIHIWSEKPSDEKHVQNFCC